MSTVEQATAQASRVYEALHVVTGAARHLAASSVMVDDRSVYVVAPSGFHAAQWRDRFGDRIGSVRLDVQPRVTEDGAA